MINSAVHSRMFACLRVEGNYFENSPIPIEAHADSIYDGYLQTNDNYFGANVTKLMIPLVNNCTLNLGYQYTLDPVMSVKSTVLTYAGVGKI